MHIHKIILILYLSIFTSAISQAQPLDRQFEEAYQKWQANMIIYGNKHGKYLEKESNYHFKLDAIYYDAQYVFYQIAQFTNQKEPWLTYAYNAKNIYNKYLTDNNFRILGFWRFPHGVFHEWKITSNPKLLLKLRYLRDLPAFSDPLTNKWATSWYSQKYGREIAYAIESNIYAERAGVPGKSKRLKKYIDMALKHIQTWTTGNWVTDKAEDQYVKPFMTALTANALIEYYEYSNIANKDKYRTDEILPAIKNIAVWNWKHMWISDISSTSQKFNNTDKYGAFKYMSKFVTGKGGPSPSPDLNLLIAPSYAWLYKNTCDIKYKTRADLIFIGGVNLNQANLRRGKQFNQNYRSSFNYIKWRNEGIKLCKYK